MGRLDRLDHGDRPPAFGYDNLLSLLGAVDWVLDAFLGQDFEKIPREHRVFERDGWMCQAPGCFSRSGLQAHHVIPRSQGGGNQDSNLLTLCWWCHHKGIHERRLSCSGDAPDGLTWEVGRRAAGPPLQVYRNGRLALEQKYAI